MQEGSNPKHLKIDPRPEPERPKRFRILLVEDHLDTARGLSRILGRSGHQVTAAHNLETAVSMASEKPFDLLVSDIGLPDGTGIELIRRLR